LSEEKGEVSSSRTGKGNCVVWWKGEGKKEAIPEEERTPKKNDCRGRKGLRKPETRRKYKGKSRTKRGEGRMVPESDKKDAPKLPQ